MPTSLKGKKVVVNGGEAATVNWLLDQGATVTVASDDAGLVKRVQDHIKKVARDGKDYEQRRARLTWEASVPVGPPGTISVDGRALSEAELFAAYWKKELITVTGRVGKTTAATWAAHLIGDAVVADSGRSAVAQLTSKARVALVCANTPGMGTTVSTDDAPEVADAAFAERWGNHNLTNLGAAIRIARIMKVPDTTIRSRTATLPQLSQHQEIIHQTRSLTVVDDTVATSPIAASAALQRWGGPNCILITGGANPQLDYRAWAEVLPEKVLRKYRMFVVLG